jgi:hypothetical protein
VSQGRDFPEPIYCVVGDTLCRLRLWTEEEWKQLTPGARPPKHIHVEGLGWLGAVAGPGRPKA